MQTIIFDPPHKHPKKEHHNQSIKIKLENQQKHQTHQIQNNENKKVSQNISIIPQTKIEKINHDKKISNQPILKNNYLNKHVKQIFQISLDQSQKNLSKFLVQKISEKRKLKQNKVYQFLTSQPRSYLKLVYDQQISLKKLIKKQIQMALLSKRNILQHELLQGNISIIQNISNTNELQQFFEKNINQHQNLIKFKSNQLRNKIDSLKEIMQNDKQFNNNVSVSLLNGDNSYIQPEDFIKKMNKQKQIHKQKIQEAKKKQIQNKLKLQKQQLQKKQFEADMRRELIKRRLQHKIQEISNFQEIRKAKKRQFKLFFKQYVNKKPLFKVKQEEFVKNVVIPESEKRSLIMKQIRQKHKSLDYQQLEEHEKKYMERLNRNRYEKLQSLKLIQSPKEGESQEKRKYRYLEYEAQKFKTLEQQKQLKSQRNKRKIQYANYVKQNFIPKIDPQKRKQFQEIIQKSYLPQNSSLERNNIQDNHFIQPVSPRKEGLKNLQKMHRMIHQLKKEGLVKKKSTNTNISTYQPKIDYLKQLKQKRVQIPFSARIQRQYGNRQLDNVEDYEKLKLHTSLLDQKVKVRQKYLRHKISSLGQDINETNKIQDQYLASIKGKITLLNGI